MTPAVKRIRHAAEDHRSVRVGRTRIGPHRAKEVMEFLDGLESPERRRLEGLGEEVILAAVELSK